MYVKHKLSFILRCSWGEYPIGGCEDFADVDRCGLGQEIPETVEEIAPTPAQLLLRCHKRRWIASAHATRLQFPLSRRLHSDLETGVEIPTIPDTLRRESCLRSGYNRCNRSVVRCRSARQIPDKSPSVPRRTLDPLHRPSRRPAL